MNGLSFTYGLGMILDGVAFYYIKEWTLIYLFVFIIPAVIILLSSIFIIEKTPIDSLATDEAD
jgi:hypothetical protein